MDDSKDPATLAHEVGAAMFEQDRASRGLGMRLLNVQPGYAKLSMRVRADMINGHAICHGGFVFTLADSAFAFACNSYNHIAVAAGCAIEFLAPAREHDELTAEAIEQTLSGRAGYYDVSVRNQRGEVVAIFRGRSQRVRGEILPHASSEQS